MVKYCQITTLEELNFCAFRDLLLDKKWIFVKNATRRISHAEINFSINFKILILAKK
jgi:hypothetical protein